MGKTIIISSHILTELSDLCTSVGVIEKGRLQYSGGIEAVRGRRPVGGRVVVRLHRETPEAEGLLRAHPLVGKVAVRGLEIGFEYRGGPAEFHTVVKVLTDRGVPLLTIGQETSTLEGLFLDVTEGQVN
jgi:ABC-2 type transport system ATP-binding protein